MGNLSEVLWTRRKWISCAVFAAMVLSAWMLPRLRVDFSISPLLEGDQEGLRRVRANAAVFPPKRYDYIAMLEWPRPLEPGDLGALERVAQELEKRFSLDVFSLPRAPVVRWQGGLPIPHRFGDLRLEEGLRAELERHPLLGTKLLSKDGRTTALYIGGGPRDEDEIHRVFEDLRRWVPRLVPDGVAVRFTGGASIQASIRRLMKQGMGESVLIEAVVFALLLPWVFRSLVGAFLPLLAVLVAALLDAGLMAALGLEVSILDPAVPALIVIIGLSDAVHLVHAFKAARLRGLDGRAALAETVRKVGPACFHTSLTTGIGFLSLLIADHVAVRAFGVKAALAVFVTYLTVMLVVPVGLSFWKGALGPPDRLTAALAKRSWRWRRSAYAAMILLLFVGMSGLSRLRVDSHVLEEIPDDDPAAVNMALYQSRFGGLFRFVVDVEGPLDDAEVFRAIEDLQVRFTGNEDVTGAESYTHWVRAALGDRTGELDQEWLRRGLAVLKSSPEFPAHVVASTLRRGRLVFDTMDLTTTQYLALVDDFNRLAKTLPPEVHAKPGGYALLAHRSARLVVTTMLGSLLLSFAAIAIFLAVIFRSLRLGLIAMLPNVIPILFVLGVGAWFDIPLRIGIVMIYALGLGLAVDDTIHLAGAFLHERRRHPDGSPREAIDAALASTGRAVVLTSLILVVGGLCYLPCGMQSLADFGLLLAVVAVSALAADLALFPSLLEWHARRSMTPADEAATGHE